MKKNLCLGGMLVVSILFLLYFYGFGTTAHVNLYIPVDQEKANGWNVYELENGIEKETTPLQAVTTQKTVLIRRIIPESWTAYDQILIDTGRATAVFVDDMLVFSNYPTPSFQLGELPLMQMPEGLSYSQVFSFEPIWVGKTITLVTRAYEDVPYECISFQLVSSKVLLLQHEAWVSKKVIPGAMFGILTLFLIGLFLFQIATSKKGYPILLLAAASALQMLCHLSDLSENPFPSIDSSLATALYFLFPLLYLGTKIKNSPKKYFAITLSTWCLYFLVFVATYVLYLPLPYWFDKVELLCFVLLGTMFYFCVRERFTNDFLRHFLSILGMFGLGYLLLFFISTLVNPTLKEYILTLFREASRLYCRPLLFWIFTTILLALFILVVWDLLQQQLRTEKEIEHMQNQRAIQNIQMQAANHQLMALRATQEQTMLYRHDIRHHFALLSGFAMDNDMERIKQYLIESEAFLDSVTPSRYCENETVNLLLSFFQAKAEKCNVELCVDVSLPLVLGISDTELCSLLSNALENSIVSASKLSEAKQRLVRIRIFVEDSKLLISTENAFTGVLVAEGNTFQSQKIEPGHGFGIKSMISIVEQHGGMYSIAHEGGVFILQLVVPMEMEKGYTYEMV